ncbi:hypothetical protein ACFE04_002559 [Oxalis oulophora]
MEESNRVVLDIIRSNRDNDMMMNKAQVKRGLWKPEEDLILKNYVEAHGEGNWALLSERSGLRRGGKSCRLRWKNYLRPNIKRGGMSKEEEDLIIRMHKLLGNRWSLIAGRLPGRTDNEVKNYWNTHLNKKCRLGKRKTTESNNYDGENDNENEDDSSGKKLCQGTDRPASQGWDGEKKENLEERTISEAWVDDPRSFSYDMEMSTPLVPTHNTSFVFDDDPFYAYLDSFVLLETTSVCSFGDQAYSQLW